VSLRVWCVGFLIVCGVLTSSPTNAQPQRDVPDDNLAYPVLIEWAGGRGFASGFYLNTPDNIYLVTAKHVLFHQLEESSASPGKELDLRSPSATLLSRDKDDPRNTSYRLSVNLDGLRGRNEVKWHDTRDVAVVHIARRIGTGEPRKLEFVPGVDAITFDVHLHGFPVEGAIGIDGVLEANEVVVFGYPNSIGYHVKEDSQLDPEQPLLRRGIVAGTNPKKRTIILECPVFPGNSGGLVIQINRGVLQSAFRGIGVISEVVPFKHEWKSHFFGWSNRTHENSGYATATPMDYVLELIE